MDVEHHLQETASSSSSCPSTLEASSSLMSGSSPKIGTGISSVLSVDSCHINSAKVAVSDMVCRLPLNHGNSKVQTSLAIGPPTQSLGAYLAHHVWCPSFILVSKFNTKISMVSTRYETCDGFPIRNNDVFSTSGHLIHLQNKNRYKGICPKVNIIARLEYELAYYDSAVHRFNHYTTRTPLGTN